MVAALLPDLADLARIDYRESFARAVAEHRLKPLVLPYGLLGPMVLPPLWLAIPHTKRPWLYRTRWLIVGLIVALNVELICTTSSYNPACAYGAGLMGSWGILHALDLLVWSRPQFEAARIVKTSKTKEVDNTSSPGDMTANNNGPRENGIRQRKLGNSPAPSTKGEEAFQSNGTTEYVWQPFPENGSFLQRLNWSADFVTNYRCIGWNSCITSVPRPQIPANILPGDPVALDTMPVVSKSGYRRSTTLSEFIWSRVRTVAILYFVLDFLAVFMVKDPYFIFGPERNVGYELPPYLNNLPPRALLVYRQIFSLAGMYAAVGSMFTLHDLIHYYTFPPIFPVRNEIWQYTTIWGPFSQVLDRGLAGWWGAFWHQTFRMQFSAPATYLIKNGYLTKGTVVAQVVTMIVAFFQSGLLHGSGSVSSIPETRIWRSPAFFLLQPVGIIIQQVLLWVLDKHLSNWPKSLRRTLNLMSTLFWLHLTAAFFCDDIASTGLWLLEPVPFSPLRMLGFGYPNDKWWRWNENQLPTWHWGNHWWTIGVQI